MTSRPIEFSAADGYVLHGTLWSPDATPRALVLIHPATAVPERLYAGFARFLTERGFAALTYDYRGIGASRPARLGALRARMRDWMELDVGAATAWARHTHEGLPLLAVGHSVGGHAIGLSAATAHLHAAVLVAAHAGSTRLIAQAAERVKVRLILRVLGPLTS
ncbi:serine aminopeptidase domain-containing protein, partial [Burkholderia sp. A2]|uniref:serine aminopeptidase domain-containing protein n=1 Tax=Burkholderia sp. A2 TaxID=236253 RepID=UPI00210CCF97